MFQRTKSKPLYVVCFEFLSIVSLFAKFKLGIRDRPKESNLLKKPPPVFWKLSTATHHADTFPFRATYYPPMLQVCWYTPQLGWVDCQIPTSESRHT